MKGLLNGILFHGFSDIIIQRYEDFTGQKAFKDETDS